MFNLLTHSLARSLTHSLTVLCVCVCVCFNALHFSFVHVPPTFERCQQVESKQFHPLLSQVTKQQAASHC